MIKRLLLVLFCGSLAATEQFELDRQDGTQLVGYWDAPAEAPFSITLILPGSQKESSRCVHDSLKKEVTEIGQCALTLEAVGKLELSLQDRLSDHLQLLKALEKNLIPGWNGKIFLIGQGDGGRIGAAFAAKTNCASGLVLIAAGGAWPAMDEALFSFRSELVDQGYSPQYIHGFLVQAKEEFSQAISKGKPENKAFGYSHKYWGSLFKMNLLEDLSRLQCPVYSINGALDDRVPIESVDALVKKLEGKITLNKKDQAGREIIQKLDIYEEALSWLEKLTRSNF